MARNADISHINERRLRPIYDCLDYGNNKKALQEADKVLKKQKDLICAKVLKGLALLRMGRQHESLKILHEVHCESPTDEPTLQAMTICYRELHKIELIADAYEKAIKKDPTNEELHSHLFMAYVRLSDYKKQQMAAMSLYKLKPKNPYYFWAVMSVLMQAISSNDTNIAQKITLPLAEKMCKKFSDENKIDSEAEVELYLLILEKQKKYNEMLTLMESPIGAKLNNNLDFLSKKRADLLKLVHRYNEAFEDYKKLINNNSDQIDYYSELIDISIKLDNYSNEKSNENNISSEYISQVMKLIEECVQRENNSINISNNYQPIRGPFLAKMLLFEHLSQRQNTSSDVEHLLKQIANSMTDLLFEYFLTFGSKQAAIYDMFYIIDKTNLTEEDIQILTLQMKEQIMSIDEEKSLNSMYKNLCYHYICHYLGQYDHLSEDERSHLINNLIEKYHDFHNNIVSKSDLTTTEPQPTDPYIILIANILFSSKELNDKTISEAILILEMGLTKSGTNFHIKLLLIRLYNMLGAVSASHTLIDSLDIKHILFDSLGYLFTAPMISCAHFSTSCYMLGNALKFYSANFKDTLDYLISCYKFGSFTKIEEILNLRERLNNSLQYSLSAVERMILDLILEPKDHISTENIINYMEIDCERDKFEWNRIRDNRDFSVIRSHHQNNERIAREKQNQTFDDELLWLKIRNLIIRLIAASHNLVADNVHKKVIINNQTKSETETNGTEKRSSIDILKELLIQFRQYIDCVKSSKFIQPLVSFDGPNASRISGFSDLSHFQLILSLIEFLIRLNNESKDESTLNETNSGDIFASIVNNLEVSVNRSNNNLLTIRCVLEDFTNTIETLSISIIFIGISQSILKNKMNISNKKSRKKRENSRAVDSVIFTEYELIVNKMKDSALRIGALFKSIDGCISDTFSKCFISAPFLENESVFSSVQQKVLKSYKQSINELSELLQNKLLYLDYLKF